MTLLYRLIFLLHITSTLAMCGIIWFVQIVHYPLFAFVETRSFPEFEKRHSLRTTWIVAPLMVFELATSIFFVAHPLAAMHHSEPLIGVALVGIIWLSTFSLQVPMHDRLGRSFDASSHRRLVQTNWLRTICWTARGVLVSTWLFRAIA